MKPELVVTKEKTMLLEFMGNQFKIDPIKFTAEHQWLGSLQLAKFQMVSGRPFTKPK